MTFQDATVLAPFIAAILVAARDPHGRLHLPGPQGPGPGRDLHGAGAGRRPGACITGQSTFEAFGGAYVVDPLTTFLDMLFISIVALTIAFAPDYLEERGLPVPEFAAMLVFAMSGAMLLAASGDLLVLFLGLELMVLPGYVLAGYHKTDGLQHRGRDQVLPARLVLERDLPVRPRVRLGHHGHHEHRRGGAATWARWRPGPSRCRRAWAWPSRS